MAHTRILVEQDDELHKSILADLSQYKKPFEKVVDAYEALNLGQMTEEVFEQIRGRLAGEIVEQYNDRLERELDNVKISNPTLRTSLLAGTGEPPKAFLRAVSEFLNIEIKPTSYIRREIGSHVHLTIDNISFEDGELYTTHIG